MTQASARHILVATEQECNELKEKIAKGEDFAAIAQTYSKCPSGKNGGELGTFQPGMMVEEFDTIVFNEEVGKVHGPIKTEFGYHLIEITQRDD